MHFYILNRAALLCAIATLPLAAVSHEPVPPAERQVGIAYANWHSSTHWQQVWGKPSLGDYTSNDRAVIRQHAEWIADAGVDFVWLDWSNNINYIPGVNENQKDQSLIESGTKILFEEYVQMKKRPRISIFLGVTLAPDAVKDGRLQRKADQIYRQYVADTRFRPLMQEYLGKPLLVVYVNTPSPFQHGVPSWNDDRFTVRWMTGFVTEQGNLRTKDLISRYGYWSWEDRGVQTYPVHDGHPESMVVAASWRSQGTPGEAGYIAPGLRNGGATFRSQWDRACSIGPRFAMVVSWNEWRQGEQPSAENSKDIEPSKEFGRFYLDLLKEEIAHFKGH